MDPNFRNIGNVDLIGKRSHRVVHVGPGGMLSDYVPFYFTPFSIMMFNIHTGYNVKQVPNDQIVILTSSLHRVAELGIRFVFTDQHAYLRNANFYTDFQDLEQLDWDLWNRKDFKHDPDDPGKKDRYQAEALIWKCLPVEGLMGICCYDSDIEERIKTELANRDLAIRTAVQRSWYFS